MSIVLLYEIDYTLEQQVKLEEKLENRRARSGPGRSELVKSVSGTAYTVSNVVGSVDYLNSPRCLRLRRAAAAVTQVSRAPSAGITHSFAVGLPVPSSKPTMHKGQLLPIRRHYLSFLCLRQRTRRSAARLRRGTHTVSATVSPQ